MINFRQLVGYLFVFFNGLLVGNHNHKTPLKQAGEGLSLLEYI